MKLAVLENNMNGVVQSSTRSLLDEFLKHGHGLAVNGEATVVFNLTTADDPVLFRRASKSVFVVSVIALPPMEDDALRALCYRTLIRTLSNLLVCIVTGADGGRRVYFVTPEVGFYSLPFDPPALYARIAPVVSARFATENVLERDLPERLRTGTAVTEDVRRYGAELNAIGVLPVPFPLESVLPERDRRHLYRIFGITGASYGNLSAREAIPEFGPSTFWMTGRGVDKSRLREIGRDIMLVKRFDEESSTAYCAVFEDTPARARVSVDAVEHHLIYEAFPEVGAIVHVHAWMDGVLCTRQNYPCGTWELAREVTALLRELPDPASGAVGLKNHGLTITGRNLTEIFDRIRSALHVTVPMYA